MDNDKVELLLPFPTRAASPREASRRRDQRLLIRTIFPRLMRQSDGRRALTGRPVRWLPSLPILLKALRHCRLAGRSRG